ncbi:MAG: SIMPL domain-containing protein [Minisyncoccota bacterium]
MNTNSFSELFDSGGVRATLIVVLAILALFLLAQTITTAEDFGRPSVPATDTITVQGSGQATLPPDVARVSFTVQNTAPAVADAQAATTKQANAAIDFVKGQGIADKDVKTLSYNISPQYSYPNPCPPGALCPAYGGTPKVMGYQVSETIQVTEHTLSAVGALLGGLGNLGVQNVNGPDFALDDSTAGYDAARADAIDKAKTQAALLAKQLGVHLGKIVNFSESSGGYPGPLYAMAATSAKVSPTPNIPTGENTYSASVSITYEIR